MNLDEFCRRLEQTLLLPDGSLTPDTVFVDIEHFDSMAQVKMLALVDELYDVQIPSSAFPSLKRARDIELFVNSAQASAGAQRP